MFILGEPLRVFHHCFFRCSHFSPLVFTIVLRMFSLLIPFVHAIFLYPDCLMAVFLSATSFVSAANLRELFFTLWRFLPYTPSLHLAQPAFIKAFLKAGSSSLKIVGPPTEVRKTDPNQSHSVQYKVLVGRFHLCVKAISIMQW